MLGDHEGSELAIHDTYRQSYTCSFRSEIVEPSSFTTYLANTRGLSKSRLGARRNKFSS